MTYIPTRGDIIYIQLSPTLGHEQANRRPAIVLSDFKHNRASQLVIVCAITQQEKGYPFEVKIPPGNEVSGVVLANQIRSVSWKDRKCTFMCKADFELYQDVVSMVLRCISGDF